MNSAWLSPGASSPPGLDVICRQTLPVGRVDRIQAVQQWIGVPESSAREMHLIGCPGVAREEQVRLWRLEPPNDLPGAGDRRLATAVVQSGGFWHESTAISVPSGDQRGNSDPGSSRTVSVPSGSTVKVAMSSRLGLSRE